MWNFYLSGALFTPGGLNQLASNGIIHSIQDVIYPYVSDEVATTQKPKSRVFSGRSDDPRLVVRLQNGRVRGINLNEDVRAWLGVPYAEAPVSWFYRFFIHLLRFLQSINHAMHLVKTWSL